MKKYSLYFLLLFCFLNANLQSQNSLKLSAHQDLKLLLVGDNKGNNAGTLDVISKLKFEAKEKELGFFIFGIEYERANLQNNFTRVGGFFGYSFKPFKYTPDFVISPAIGYGSIMREDVNVGSYTAHLQIYYQLNNFIRASVLNQFTQRSDLRVLYNDEKLRFSFFVGLEINLFNF